MFNFAVSRGIVDVSPCLGVERPSAKNQRDRVLSDSEIKTFWDKLSETKMSEGSRLALKFMLVTAQRKGEVVLSEWSEFNIEKNIWNIPKEKSKNRLAHRVPLSSQALDLLEEIKKVSGGSNYLFPSPRDKKAPVTTRSISKAVKKNSDVFGLKQWIPHDLRRTAASHMAESGVPSFVIGLVLNHKQGGVTATYDRHSYDREKRQALDK